LRHKIVFPATKIFNLYKNNRNISISINLVTLMLQRGSLRKNRIEKMSRTISAQTEMHIWVEKKKIGTRISHVINADKEVRGTKASLTFTRSTWSRPFFFFCSSVGPAGHVPSLFHGTSRVIARAWLPLIFDNRAALMPQFCDYVLTEIAMVEHQAH